MICKYCNSRMDDLTHGYGKHRNYMCFGIIYTDRSKRDCHAHYWKGKWYTKKEWDEYIDEDAKQDSKRTLDFIKQKKA